MQILDFFLAPSIFKVVELAVTLCDHGLLVLTDVTRLAVHVVSKSPPEVRGFHMHAGGDSLYV